MAKILIILVIAFAFEAFGVIALKRGIDQITVGYHERKAATPVLTNVLKLIGDWFTNKDVLFGLLLETLFFIGLQYLLGQRDVSFVWPLTALSFVMTTLAAKFMLHERVDGIRWGGVALIMLGSALVTWSEKDKPHSGAATLTAEPTSARQ